MTCRYSPYLTAALQAHSNGLPPENIKIFLTRLSARETCAILYLQTRIEI